MKPAQALLSVARALSAAAALAGCAEQPIVAPLNYSPLPATPDEAFRAEPPAPSPAVPLAPVDVHSASLANGLRVVVLERHALPIVSVRLVVARGLADLAAQERDTYKLLGQVMGGGTARRTPNELETAWTNLGAGHAVAFGSDGAWLTARARAGDFDAALDLLAEQATRPRLLARDVAAAQSRWLGDDERFHADPTVALGRNVSSLMFGPGHPYSFSRPHEGRAGAITVEALSALHARLFQPALATLIVAGDVTAEAAGASAVRCFGGWAAAGPPAARPPLPAPVAGGARVVLVHRSDRAQVHVQVLVRLPALSSDEIAAVDVLSRALGGLSSPLRHSVRDESGAAYSFGAGVTSLRGGGYVGVGGVLEASLAVATLRNILSALADARRRGVAADLVDGARASLLADWRARASRTDGLAGTVTSAVLEDRPIEEAFTFPARLAAVTPEAVRRVAERYFTDAAIRAVVVGDGRRLGDLASLGLGPIERRNESAELVGQ